MDLGSAATTDGGVGEAPDISAIETALSCVVEMQLPIYQTTYELRAAADSLLKLLTDACSAEADDVTRLAGACDAEQSAYIHHLTHLEADQGLAHGQSVGERPPYPGGLAHR